MNIQSEVEGFTFELLIFTWSLYLARHSILMVLPPDPLLDWNMSSETLDSLPVMLAVARCLKMNIFQNKK